MQLARHSIRNNHPKNSPLPDLPTNLRSLNLATWFLKVAVALRRSAAQFSSFPAVRMTLVPSGRSLSEMTLKGTGSVLLQRQCEGRMVQTKFGLFVRTNSPGYSARTSENVLSPRKRLTGEFSVGEEAIRCISFIIVSDKSPRTVKCCLYLRWLYFLFYHNTKPFLYFYFFIFQRYERVATKTSAQLACGYMVRH